jgi:hypothetical protein
VFLELKQTGPKLMKKKRQVTVSVEAFMATKFNEMLSDRQPQSGCEVLPMFHGLTLSTSSRRSGGLAEAKQVTKWHHMKCPRKTQFQSAPLEGQSRATIFQVEKGYSCGFAALGTSVDSHYSTETKRHVNATSVKSVLLVKYQNLFLHDNARPHTAVLVPMKPSHILD